MAYYEGTAKSYHEGKVPMGSFKTGGLHLCVGKKFDKGQLKFILFPASVQARTQADARTWTFRASHKARYAQWLQALTAHHGRYIDSMAPNVRVALNLALQ